MQTLLLAATQTDPPPVWLTFAIIGGFFVVFPLFWCFVVWLLSRLGDWHSLSRNYAAGIQRPDGDRHSGISGRIGWVNYNHVLTVHVADDGFFLEVMPLFRIGHPRLFIPWIAISERSTRQLFWLKLTVLKIGKPVIGTISIALADDLLLPPLPTNQSL